MELDYKVVYSKRKTIGIYVERDRTVIVRAPEGVTLEKIQLIVDSKRYWLFQKINHKQKYPEETQMKEFISGESMLYLGKNYKIDLTGNKDDGLIFNGKFVLSPEIKSKAYDLFKNWYMIKAEEKIIPKAIFFAERMGVNYKSIKVSDLKYSWGSCSPQKNINFNWRIIKAPMNVLEYIIVHELAHLIELNHTKDFWNIVSVQVPMYKKAKDWLKDNGYQLEKDF